MNKSIISTFNYSWTICNTFSCNDQNAHQAKLLVETVSDETTISSSSVVDVSWFLLWRSDRSITQKVSGLINYPSEELFFSSSCRFAKKKSPLA